MYKLWSVLACLAGAFDFLLAVILRLQDTTPPMDRTDSAFQFADAFVFSVMASALCGFEKNVSTRREEPRLFCGGLGRSMAAFDATDDGAVRYASQARRQAVEGGLWSLI